MAKGRQRRKAPGPRSCNQGPNTWFPPEQALLCHYFFFPAPSTIAVFLCPLAALTLMNLPEMALRPMPGAFLAGAFFAATFFAAFRGVLFLAMVMGCEHYG